MEENPSQALIALKWGAIGGVAYMIYTTLLYVTELYGNSTMGWVSFALAIVFIVLAMREYRTQNNGFMSYGEGLGVGTLVSAISGLLSATYGMIYTMFIDPTIPQKLQDKIQEQWEAQGLTDEQIEQASEMMKWTQSPGMTFLFGMISAIVGGLIISLIVAAILKKNKPVFE